ncbi:DUF3040 domain-containing protein [Lentzea cavernae]|uniref:DUF3040 domain-containing protein n=1 Tax=Lentzea cavernae TaxID=2020703 RepID=A0ABQ3MEM9_9PSEU|nr:DUF3040 domain-containing protein [Lentzea cavernae]GHH40734.1 hypothetical protein GCM10017774_34590 [Lentzea cavernae]
MNRREQRALREIEKNISIDDPRLAEELRSFGSDDGVRKRWYAGAGAVALLLVGANAGSSVILLAGLVMMLVLGLKWTLEATR